MDKIHLETDILALAVEALQSNAGLKAEIVTTTTALKKPSERIPDAELHLLESGARYLVETKRHAPQANLGALIDRVKRLGGSAPGLLAADYINPAMAEKLKQADIEYIDTAGNAYINRQPVYVLITGRKKRDISIAPEQGQINRAFEPKGLLVTYSFLANPSLVSKPYREIAQVSGVAVGTVGWVMNALKAGEYLHQNAETGERNISNYHRLLDRWVSAWPEKLRHKHLLGRFTAKDNNWWKNTDIRQYEACWGGETAASVYTKRLQPQITTAYVPKSNLKELIRDSRLSKAANQSQERSGLVYLYSPFWITSNRKGGSGENDQTMYEARSRHWPIDAKAAAELAHPIIVYADMIATGDPRNLEIAQLLRHDYIAEPDRAT